MLGRFRDRSSAASSAREAALALEAVQVRAVWRQAVKDLDLPRIRITKVTRTSAGAHLLCVRPAKPGQS